MTLKNPALILILSALFALSSPAFAQADGEGVKTPDAGALDILKDPDADLDARDAAGTTPLMRALRDGQAETAEKLIWSGADIAAADALGFTAAHFAAARHLTDLLPLLLDGGADFSIAAKDGIAPLHLAVFANLQTAATEEGWEEGWEEWEDAGTLAEMRRETVGFILDNGGIIDAAGPGGRTAAHLAAVAGLADVLEILANRGADFSALDDDGKTPLILAKDNDHADAVEILSEY